MCGKILKTHKHIQNVKAIYDQSAALRNFYA